MNMIDAVTTGFKKYAEFSGRASRSEYWYFWLLYLIVDIAARLSVRSPILNSLFFLALVAMFIPLLAVSARRLHDTNRSGWWMLLLPIVNIVFYCQATVPEPGNPQASFPNS